MPTAFSTPLRTDLGRRVFGAHTELVSRYCVIAEGEDGRKGSQEPSKNFTEDAVPTPPTREYLAPCP